MIDYIRLHFHPAVLRIYSQGFELQYLHYGLFVQSLALEYGETDIPERYHTDWLRFLMDYTREPNQEGVLTLWPNVVQALREIGW